MAFCDLRLGQGGVGWGREGAGVLSVPGTPLPCPDL